MVRSGAFFQLGVPLNLICDLIQEVENTHSNSDVIFILFTRVKIFRNIKNDRCKNFVIVEAKICISSD